MATLLPDEDAPVTVPVPQAVAGAAAVAGQVATGPPRLAMAVQARAVAEERIGLTAAADGVATTAGTVGPTVVVLGGRPTIVRVTEVVVTPFVDDDQGLAPDVRPREVAPSVAPGLLQVPSFGLEALPIVRRRSLSGRPVTGA